MLINWFILLMRIKRIKCLMRINGFYYLITIRWVVRWCVTIYMRKSVYVILQDLLSTILSNLVFLIRSVRRYLNKQFFLIHV